MQSSKGFETSREYFIEVARAGMDFSKCQMDRVAEAYHRDPRKVEWESISPYLADYNGATGEMWNDQRMAKHDRIGLAIAKVLRGMLPNARMVSLYDEYNSGLPDSTDARGMPTADAPQLVYPEETRHAFRTSVEGVLKRSGVIQPKGQEGEDYLFVSESEKVQDAEELVRRLEQKGLIAHYGMAIDFVSQGVTIPLRTKSGRWLCEALDASSFLKPENREITHLVILPNAFKAQQDKVWEILKALDIARPETYHNIFFDDKLDSEAVAEVIRQELEKHEKKAVPARVAA